MAEKPIWDNKRPRQRIKDGKWFAFVPVFRSFPLFGHWYPIRWSGLGLLLAGVVLTTGVFEIANRLEALGYKDWSDRAAFFAGSIIVLTFVIALMRTERGK
jgi:hypothetical protein